MDDQVAEEIYRKMNFLTREVQHRVYNNLQVVDSFLDIQEIFLQDEHDRRQIRDLRRRLELLGMILRETYDDAKDFSPRLSSFLSSLLRMLGAIYKQDLGNPDFRDFAEDDRLDLDRAVPLGLLFHELFLLLRNKNEVSPVVVELAGKEWRGRTISLRFLSGSSVPGAELLQGTISAALIPCFLRQCRASLKFLCPEDSPGETVMVVSLPD